MASDPTPADGLERFKDIPDPAAFLADRPPPPEAEAPPVSSLTRQQLAMRRAIAVIGAFLWVGGNVASWGLRPDLRTPAVSLTLVLWVVLGAAGLMLSLGRRGRGLPTSVRTVQAILIAIPTGFALAAVASSSLTEPVPENSLLPCLTHAFKAALLPLAVAALVLQRSFLSTPIHRGAAVGAVCGLAGAIGIHAHCPYLAMSHVLLAHGPPILACALVGALLGAWRGRG
jgi:hypothetical protein